MRALMGVCFLSFGEAWLPLAACEECQRTELLFDCEPELAWPKQWLCMRCVGDAEIRRRLEDLDAWGSTLWLS